MLKVNTIYEYYNGYYVFLGVEETDFFKLKFLNSLVNDCQMIYNTGIAVTGAKDLLKKVVQQDMSTFAFLYIASNNQSLDKVLSQPLQNIDNMQIVYATLPETKGMKVVYSDTEVVHKWIMKNCIILEEFNYLYNSKVFLSYKEALTKYMHQLDAAWPDLFEFYYRIKESKYMEKPADKPLDYHLYCYYRDGSKYFALYLPDKGLIGVQSKVGVSTLMRSILKNPVRLEKNITLFDTGIKCRFVEKVRN